MAIAIYVYLNKNIVLAWVNNNDIAYFLKGVS